MIMMVSSADSTNKDRVGTNMVDSGETRRFFSMRG